MSSSLVMIGKVGRPHGIRGAFFFHPIRYLGSAHKGHLGDEGVTVGQPFGFEVIHVGDGEDTAKTLQVSAIRHAGGKLVVSCPEVGDRTAAEALVGKRVFIGRDQLDMDEDEYLWDDLIERDVHDVEGARLGRVIDVYNAGASDIVIIEGDDGRRLDLPLVDVYFQPDFGDPDATLKLVVKGDTFAELWRLRHD